MKVIKDLIVSEISGVDSPAQKPAVAAVIKGDGMADQNAMPTQGIDVDALLKQIDERIEKRLADSQPAASPAPEPEQKSADPVVYTTKAGVQVRKSEGDLAIELALQWGHAFSGMDISLHIIIPHGAGSLQWGHALSGMDTGKFSVWIHLGWRSFNGAMPFQAWIRR